TNLVFMGSSLSRNARQPVDAPARPLDPAVPGPLTPPLLKCLTPYQGPLTLPGGAGEELVVMSPGLRSAPPAGTETDRSASLLPPAPPAPRPPAAVASARASHHP